jgi:hypothetical protein
MFKIGGERVIHIKSTSSTGSAHAKSSAPQPFFLKCLLTDAVLMCYCRGSKWLNQAHYFCCGYTLAQLKNLHINLPEQQKNLSKHAFSAYFKRFLFIF